MKGVVAMASPESPDWIGQLITALGGISVGGYALFRIFRRDKVSDTIDQKSQQQNDNLAGHLEAERATNIKLMETIDRIAGERNEAVRNVGQLEGHVQALESQITHLREEVTSLRLENDRLINEVGVMQGQCNEMRSEVTKLVQAFADMAKGQ